ncbi:hypothetical protein JKP88DRAFT_207226 [Tribonema minus]|uniref:PDZ domain-containing protein n=1 Tax=Tribonema minus TaxID=303371 RepID=A0A835Z6S1_9STRA|nr:hypothetical protein JKP88DRAFT_207226 [Tribonema minus]
MRCALLVAAAALHCAGCLAFLPGAAGPALATSAAATPAAQQHGLRHYAHRHACCRHRRWPHLQASSDADSGEEEETAEEDDPRLHTATISRATGIDWGTDLSFRWVYVRALEPNGSAARTGLVSKGDQLVSFNGESCVGAPFDFVMSLFSKATGTDVDLAFFRGTTAELRALAGGGDGADAERARITVQQPGKADLVIECAAGANLRDVLVGNGVNVYQSLTRWTNCKGRQLCGTCIVDVAGASDACTIKSVDERSTLRSNPPSYRLSCVTNVYKDITVQIFPPIGRDQWTR